MNAAAPASSRSAPVTASTCVAESTYRLDRRLFRPSMSLTTRPEAICRMDSTSVVIRASPGLPRQVDKSTPCRSPKNSGGAHGFTNTWMSRPSSRATRASDRTLSLATLAGDQHTITAAASASAFSIVCSHGADGGMSSSHQISRPALRSALTSLRTRTASSRLYDKNTCAMPPPQSRGNANRLYLQQQLPWGLPGEAKPSRRALSSGRWPRPSRVARHQDIAFAHQDSVAAPPKMEHRREAAVGCELRALPRRD